MKIIFLFLITVNFVSGQNPKEYVRGCYFTNWAQYRPGRAKFSPNNYQPGLCSHIFYAFAYVDANFNPIPSDPSDIGPDGQYGQINNLKSADPKLKTLLSFGGASFSSFTFSQLVSSGANRKVFIDSAISYLRQHNFDGIDIDWEYPSANDKKNFLFLITEFKNAAESESKKTGKSRLLVTAAVAAGIANTAGYDFRNLAQVLDFINVMTYDFHGSWETVTGHNSPLFNRSGETDFQQQLNTAYVANYYHLQGFPKEKLVIGIPTYGRGWTLSNSGNSGVGASATSTSNPFQFTQTAGIGSYYEICEVVASGGSRIFDHQARVPYVFNGNQWFSYDDIESTENKANWIKNNGFGGGFFWTLDFDDFNGQCSNSGGTKYPIIGTLKKILG